MAQKSRKIFAWYLCSLRQATKGYNMGQLVNYTKNCICYKHSIIALKGYNARSLWWNIFGHGSQKCGIKSKRAL